MIYTVTFNPALDYVMKADEIEFGCTNRTYAEEISVGGKGINVSCVLSNLRIPNKALGFVAGFTGDYIEDQLSRQGIDCDFIRLKSGFSRINVKLKSCAETELNAKGPDITKADVDALFTKLKRIEPDDVLVLAGSVPSSVDDGIYQKIMQMLFDKKTKIVVDASKSLLVNCLEHKPFLIKPNKQEIEEIFKEKFSSIDDIFSAAAELKSRGAVNVLVSLGDKGALLLDEFGKKHICKAHKGVPVNTVGAGDSMVAGFIAGMKNGYEYALRLGNAAGAATAFSGALATEKQIINLMNKSSDC